MPERVQIVGGPNDGKMVLYVGTRMFEPVRPPLRFQPTDEPPDSVEIETRTYTLHQWCDESGHVEPRYVLDDVAKGLGAE